MVTAENKLAYWFSSVFRSIRWKQRADLKRKQTTTNLKSKNGRFGWVDECGRNELSKKKKKSSWFFVRRKTDEEAKENDKALVKFLHLNSKYKDAEKSEGRWRWGERRRVKSWLAKMDRTERNAGWSVWFWRIGSGFHKSAFWSSSCSLFPVLVDATELVPIRALWALCIGFEAVGESVWMCLEHVGCVD